MPEIVGAALQAIADLADTWTLDPRRTTIQFRTKAMWILNVTGTLRATEGNGAVDPNGRSPVASSWTPVQLTRRTKRATTTCAARTNGGPALTAEQRGQLAARGIALDEKAHRRPRRAGYRVFGDSGRGMRPKNWPMASAAFRSWVVRPRTNGALRGPGMVWPPACTVYRVTGGLPSCW